MIRSLGQDDLPAIYRISSQASYSSSWTRANLEAELKAARGFGWFAEGGLQAFIFFREIGQNLEISWLATDPQARGQGLMFSFIQHQTQSFSDALGREFELWLEVHEANTPARNLYVKLGFCQVGLRPRYYPDGGAALLMSLKIT